MLEKAINDSWMSLCVCVGSNWILRQIILSCAMFHNSLIAVKSPQHSSKFIRKPPDSHRRRWATLINIHTNTFKTRENTQKPNYLDSASLSVNHRCSLRETHAIVGKQFSTTLSDSIFTGFSSDFSLFPKCVLASSLTLRIYQFCPLNPIDFTEFLPSANVQAIKTLNRTKIILSSFIVPRLLYDNCRGGINCLTELLSLCKRLCKTHTEKEILDVFSSTGFHESLFCFVVKFRWKIRENYDVSFSRSTTKS